MLFHFNRTLFQLYTVETTIKKLKKSLDLDSIAVISGCYVTAYLDRVVKSFKDSNALGAELQVNKTLHGEGDSLMLHSFLTGDHHHSSQDLLKQNGDKIQDM